MAGDVLAALFLAVSTTQCWQRSIAKRTSTTHRVDRLLLQPPWNLPLFFLLYGGFFLMLAQPVFAVSVIGQVLMGTCYVFTKQAVQESYVVLSHGSHSLFRKLEFLGSASFNLFMATSSAVNVQFYDRIGRTAPFYLVAAIAGAWSAIVAAYFMQRMRGCGETFAAAEARLLASKGSKAAGCRGSGGGAWSPPWSPRTSDNRWT